MTIINKNWTAADIFCDAIGERSLRGAADWLNERLPDSYRRSHTTIQNWLSEVFPIPHSFIDALIKYYPEDDPRHQLGKALSEKRGFRNLCVCLDRVGDNGPCPVHKITEAVA